MPRHLRITMKKGNAMTKALGGKIVDKASDVISAPIRAFYDSKGAKATRDADILRKTRMYDDAPNFTSKGTPTDALKMRTASEAIKSRYK